MRTLKMFGLAAITAVAAMAFVGVTSASATGSTAVCTTNSVLACPVGNQPLFVNFVEKGGQLLGTVNIKCAETLMKGHALGLANPLQVHLTELIYHKCTYPFGSCTITTTKLGLLLILKTAADLGLVTGHGTSINIKCGFIVNCTFTDKELTGHALSAGTGGAPANGAVTYANAPVTSESGGLCPEEAKLDVSFVPTVPLWVRS